MRSSLLFVALTLLVNLAGCGTKGPLYLPQPPQAGFTAKTIAHGDTNP